jgi:hypothetical protein
LWEGGRHAVCERAAKAVVIGTVAIRPIVPTALRTSSWAISRPVSSSRPASATGPSRIAGTMKNSSTPNVTASPAAPSTPATGRSDHREGECRAEDPQLPGPFMVGPLSRVTVHIVSAVCSAF